MKKKKNKLLISLLMGTEVALGIAISNYYVLPRMLEKQVWKARTYEQMYNDTENTSIAKTQEESGISGNSDTTDDVYIPELDVESVAAQQVAEAEVGASVSLLEEGISVMPSAVTVIATDGSDTNYVQEGHDNTSAQLIDMDLSTSWQVNASDSNPWVEFAFDREYSINNIILWLGVWSEAEGKDYYNGNYRPQRVLIEAGGKQWDVSFQDVKCAQQVAFSMPVMASSIKFTVLDNYIGDQYDQTGIAEIGIY